MASIALKRSTGVFSRPSIPPVRGLTRSKGAMGPSWSRKPSRLPARRWRGAGPEWVPTGRRGAPTLKGRQADQGAQSGHPRFRAWETSKNVLSLFWNFPRREGCPPTGTCKCRRSHSLGGTSPSIAELEDRRLAWPPGHRLELHVPGNGLRLVPGEPGSSFR
jgi:hypothetical protein